MSDKKQLSDKCAVTRDLMPLCIDGTASEASQRRVDKHVAGCDPCAVVYREMQTQIDLDLPVEQETAQFETAVKKVKHKHIWRKVRNVLLGVVLALVVCAGLAYGYYWYFVEEVPLPIDLYEVELALQASDRAARPVIIQTKNMPKPAELHIQVEADGTVMDDNQRMRPNWIIYIWASTTRATNLDTCGYTDYNYYGFDQAAKIKNLWLVQTESIQADVIYKGAPEGEKTLLYKTAVKEDMKTTAVDHVLHAVSSISVKDDGKLKGDDENVFPFVTPAPTVPPTLTREPVGIQPAQDSGVTFAPVQVQPTLTPRLTQVPNGN